MENYLLAMKLEVREYLMYVGGETLFMQRLPIVIVSIACMLAFVEHRLFRKVNISTVIGFSLYKDKPNIGSMRSCNNYRSLFV